MIPKREWLEIPNTQKLIKDIKADIQELEDRWASGEFTGESADETVQLNAKAIGMTVALESMLHTLCQLEDEEEEDLEL